MSYNECADIDCQGLFYIYGTVEILADYGFVEDYPQKWIWRSVPFLEHNEPNLVMGLDRIAAPDPYYPQNQTEQFQVTWHTDARPDLQVVAVMSGHLKVLEEMESFVQEATEALSSNHERYTIQKFYKSLRLFLQHAIWSYYDEALDELAISQNDGNNGDESTTRYYDNLESRAVIGNPEDLFLTVCHPIHEQIGPEYESMFKVQSQYQSIEFTYGEEEDDTCLWLSGWGQTCSSFRQYHEALVHYPASFLPQIKRVAYIGGGDNMILHEILKYSSIELVLGLELDQDVVRYSFMNMGTLPYFDDPRVQWWFGDATKSLSMLPQDYFGSFDLVLVDLQTFVADALFVTDTLSMMDTMKLLLKPNGIISKNEDFPNRKITDFAKYTVDMEYCDLPQLCRQSITIGSNGINFLTAPQYEHDINTIYMNESLEEQGKFNNWYDFRDNHAETKSTAAATPKEASGNPTQKNHGVLVVIEADELSRSVNAKEEFVEALTKALGANGIEVLDVDYWSGSESHFDVVLIFRQGYLILRKRSVPDNYVAMDLELWDDIAKVNLLKKTLIESIGGDEQKASSYRVVTGGIQGNGGDSYLINYVAEEETCENRDTTGTEAVTSKGLSLVWSEVTKLIPGGDASIVVLCGSKDSPCAGWDALKASSIDAVALYTCERLSEDSNDEARLFQCEAEVVKTIRATLSSKVNGIWLDKAASKTMAKVLLRLLTGQIGRAEFLDNNNYTVLVELTGEEWQEIFLERFRTEVSPFAPAKEARLSFSDEKTFSFFSAGDEAFYSSVAKWMAEVEKKIGVKPSLDTVMSGHAYYVPNFSPLFFNNQAYDNSRAHSQWQSQKPTGYQTISQMELKAPKIRLKVGEEVLFQFHDDVWMGMWTKATVLRQNEDLTYNIKTKTMGTEESIPRDSLRRLDFDATASPIPTIDIGARVIYKRGGHWAQGFVVSRSEDGVNYEIRESDGVISEVTARDLIPQFEMTHAEALPSLSMVRLEKLLRKALSDASEDANDIELRGHGIGDGCVITAFRKGFSTVLVWDGAEHIDINLFLDDEDEEAANRFHNTFMENIPFLATSTRDEQPRGYGSVVNFKTEIVEYGDPIWRPGAFDED
jgi:spermidine synthase